MSQDVIKTCMECGSIIDDDGVPLECTGSCGEGDFLHEDDHTELDFSNDGVMRELEDFVPEDEFYDEEEWDEQGC